MTDRHIATYQCSACSHRECPCTLHTSIINPNSCPGDGGRATWIRVSE